MHSRPYPLGPALCLGLASLLGAFPAVGAVAGPSDPIVGGSWVATWGAAPQALEPKDRPPAPGLAHQTLRQIVQVSLGGSRIRLQFSNVFTAEPVTLAVVGVAAAERGSTIRTGTSRAVSFQGRPTVTLAPETTVYSDPLPFDLAPLSELAVTIRFGEAPAAVTGHPGSRCTSYLQAGDAVMAASLPGAAEMPHWYVLSGVEVARGPDAAAVVVLGDSITDGRGSTTDRNRRWTDDLAHRLQADPRTAHIGVVNQGIGGNRLLRDGLGSSALARLDRDVFGQRGARWLIVLEGVNDIGQDSRSEAGAIAREVIGAYDAIIRRAHAGHLQVFGATLTPIGGSFYFSPVREQARSAVNDWIRTSGRFDAVIDFDAAVRDPANPIRLAAPLDCGDHLHLSDAGYAVMANAVDLTLFAR